ncbi:MAG: hypothetical protein WDO24_28675 [Pseudomonadota bacterium]
MARAAVDGLRSLELGVRDLAASIRFYTETWGLRVVAADARAATLRGTGPYHHLLGLRARPEPALLRLDLTAPDPRFRRWAAPGLARGRVAEIAAPGPARRAGVAAMASASPIRTAASSASSPAMRAMPTRRRIPIGRARSPMSC